MVFSKELIQGRLELNFYRNYPLVVTSNVGFYVKSQSTVKVIKLKRYSFFSKVLSIGIAQATPFKKCLVFLHICLTANKKGTLPVPMVP